jgi:hypothetical protein
MTDKKTTKMSKKIMHQALGLFIEEELRRAGVKIMEMCEAINMGHSTYAELKGASISTLVTTKASWGTSAIR